MRIAIVTGASSGMGREMVYRLADRFGGLEEIWVIARREEKLKEFEGKLPTAVRRFALDLTKEADLAALEDALRLNRPNVKILVNAAGFGISGAVSDIPRSQSAAMVRLNAEALTSVTEMVLPYISENSRILQFASAAAFMPQPGFAVYAATKSYVLSYSRALNAELKPRQITVTAVCPGPVMTEFFDTALKGKTLAPCKKLFMARPETVVRRAVSDSMMGKELSIAGFPMKAFALICRLLPHSLLMKFCSCSSGQCSQCADRKIT